MGSGPPMPPLVSLRARSWCADLVCAVFVSIVVGSSHGALAVWPFSSAPSTEGVGTAQWWKKNKSKAVFDPGKGYKIEGIDGYFDGDGRPIASPAAIESVI